MTTYFRNLLTRIRRILNILGERLASLQDECDRLSAEHWRSTAVDHPEWDMVFAKSEDVRKHYVNMLSLYRRTAVRAVSL